MALQPVGEKYLLYETRGVHVDNDEQESLPEGNSLWFWNDRLILMEHENDDKFWRFTALDLITSETRPVHFSKSQSKFDKVNVIPLNEDFGFVVESAENIFCVNLIKLNWAPGEFQLIERFDFGHDFLEIIVNSLSRSKFVLGRLNGENVVHQACNLDNGKIKFGDTYEAEVFFQHYVGDKLIDFFEDQIETYDWKTKEEQSFEIEDNLDVEIDNWCAGWTKDRLYSATCFDDENGTEKDGIAYTDLETKRWTLLDFVINAKIRSLQYFNGNLIVFATNEDVFKIYSIPVKQPQSLRKMAWSLVVQGLKRDESITNPYQTAAKFLPFNSDLRSLWYKDETALENLEESKSNDQSQGEAAVGKSTLSQESSKGVSPKRQKFN